AADRRHQRAWTVLRRHGFSACFARRVRCSCRLLSRSGDDSCKVSIVWRGRQRYVGIAFYQNFGRPRHCIRHRGQGTRRTFEYGCRDQARRRAFHTSRRELSGSGSLKLQRHTHMENYDATTTQKENRRMLVADDDPAILRLIATILEKENFTVVTARDGREAYKTLQADADFTAAILDVVMPHISGPELVRYMKAEERLRKIPVMMMTAEQDPKLSSDSFSAGAIVFLPKPFTTAQLQIMLQMLIGKQPAEQ